MTRGPVPKKAIAEAVKVAQSRGAVMDMAEFADSRQDFILFILRCTVFIQVRRIRARVADPEEIDRLFHEDVLECRRIPQTLVVSREIWVLTPWNCWQSYIRSFASSPVSAFSIEISPTASRRWSTSHAQW